jgi:hypothetical protein
MCFKYEELLIRRNGVRFNLKNAVYVYSILSLIMRKRPVLLKVQLLQVAETPILYLFFIRLLFVAKYRLIKGM